MKSLITGRNKAVGRIVAVGTVALAAAVAMTGCTSSNGGTAKGKHQIVIGVAEASVTNSFLHTLDDAITAQAAKYGYKTKILDGQFKDEVQAANVATLTADKVDAIIVISSSPTATNANIAKARAKGIPVFAVNAALDPTAQVLAYIGDSDFDYGVGEGKLLNQALPNGGNAAIILGPITDTPTKDRLAGIKSVLNSNIKILSTPVDGFDAQKDKQAVQDLLSKYPKGQIDAIAAEGPQVYLGAQYAFQHGRNEIKFIAGDYPKQVEAAIKAGQVYGTVNQSPALEGQLGADYVHYWLTGQKSKIKKTEIIPLPTITADNVGSNPSAWSM